MSPHLRRLLTAWLLLLHQSASLASDPRPVCPSTAEGVRQRTDAVFSAWAEQAREEYDRQRELLFVELACVQQVVDPEVAIRVHLVVAMDAYMARHEDTAKAALRAVACLRPGIDPSQIVQLPPDLDGWLRADRCQSVAHQTVRGRWAFDGDQTDQRPSDRPTVAQRLGPRGPTSTLLLSAAEPLPEPASWTSLSDPALQTPIRANPRLWWTASGTSAIIATGLWIGTVQAGAAHQANLNRYPNARAIPASKRPEVEATLHRANTLSNAAIGFTIASAGFGIVGFTLKK